MRREKASASPPSTMLLMRTAAELQRDQGRQRGERNGEEDSDGGTHAAEEDQDHQAGEKQADAAFVQERRDRCFHEVRLVEDDAAGEGRGGIEEFGEFLANAIHHLQSCLRRRPA